MPVIRQTIDHDLMAKQRAARLARDAQRTQRIAELRAQRTVTTLLPVNCRRDRTNAQTFWDNIDTSGGPDACHPWRGYTHWNHREETGWERFEQGHYKHPAVATHISTRVLIFLIYGKELPRTFDVTPLCGDHLCHNVRHLVITKHGGPDTEKKINNGVPVEEFFCVPA